MTGRFLWSQYDGSVMYPVSATMNNISLDTSLVVRSDVDMCQPDTDMLQSQLMFDRISLTDQGDNVMDTVLELVIGMMLDQINSYLDNLAMTLIKQFLETSDICKFN